MIELVCMVDNFRYGDRVLHRGDMLAAPPEEIAHLLQLGGVSPHDRCFMRRSDFEAAKGGGK
jgi:hypothetical protein